MIELNSLERPYGRRMMHRSARVIPKFGHLAGATAGDRHRASQIYLSFTPTFLGHVEKGDSHRALSMIQVGIYNGDRLATRLDAKRGMGVI